VSAMRPGSVIVDLAAEAGGNCALTRRDETVISPNGVQIVGQTNLPSTMPHHASQLYSRNVHALLGVLVKENQLALDMEDEIVRGTTIVQNGQIVHKPTLDTLAGAAS
jgi:proton-translocating NAD(P)+ transhydrogenase subunit alpha